jgi:hypothetical protein
MEMIVSRKKHKPRVFVGSSRESLAIARGVQNNLDPGDADVTVWPQGVFKISQYGLESLLEATRSNDFGVFVFAPDDLTTIRHEQYSTVRDNVLFELGLFMGRLGRERVFVVIPRGAKLHLATDLSGWNMVDYDPKRKDIGPALGVACNQIREEIQRLGHFKPGSPTENILAAANTIEGPAPVPSVDLSGRRQSKVVRLGDTRSSAPRKSGTRSRPANAAKSRSRKPKRK